MKLASLLLIAAAALAQNRPNVVSPEVSADGRVTLRLHDPSRSDRLEFRIADATFTQESVRRTARKPASRSVTAGELP